MKILKRINNKLRRIIVENRQKIATLQSLSSQITDIVDALAHRTNVQTRQVLIEKTKVDKTQKIYF